MVRCENIVAELRGCDRPGEIVLIGAHYDTAAGTPGANDNASGVAAMLEIAAAMAPSLARRTVRFVAFANEEPPFFMTPQVGSEAHAARALDRGEHIEVMFALDTVGFYSDAPRSQSYPTPLLYAAYPHRGNFVALVGNMGSLRVVRRSAAVMRSSCGIPVRWAAPPALVSGAAWSDHRAFFRRGIPAFMITDTTPFRYPWYHDPGDTPDRLDYARLAEAVRGAAALARHWAEAAAATETVKGAETAQQEAP